MCRAKYGVRLNPEIQMSGFYRKLLYNGVCACAALGVASYALLPVSAATADALSYRGGQFCSTGGCHDVDSHCTGSGACEGESANACVQSDKDTNRETCGADSGYCRDIGCNGADRVCGGR
jgi:hypothetical protein